MDVQLRTVNLKPTRNEHALREELHKQNSPDVHKETDRLDNLRVLQDQPSSGDRHERERVSPCRVGQRQSQEVRSVLERHPEGTRHGPRKRNSGRRLPSNVGGVDGDVECHGAGRSFSFLLFVFVFVIVIVVATFREQD